MFEKVNPSHPDKVADRIAGALVDYAYSKEKNPRIAVEVLIGHGQCLIIAETSVHIEKKFVKQTVKRIAKERVRVKYKEVPQNNLLAANQEEKIRCGDNGIFKGVPPIKEETFLSELAHEIYEKYPTDGKYLINGNTVTVCHSNVRFDQMFHFEYERPNYIFLINPLGHWYGGVNVDSGATNRKLGSDMGRAITGGGLHGKDLSKADVTLNIYAHLVACKTKKPFLVSCSIGDDVVDGKPYEELVKIAKEYIDSVGGFEKFAEWGLI